MGVFDDGCLAHVQVLTGTLLGRYLRVIRRPYPRVNEPRESHKEQST